MSRELTEEEKIRLARAMEPFIEALTDLADRIIDALKDWVLEIEAELLALQVPEEDQVVT